MAIEKWHHPYLYCFPISFSLTILYCETLGKIFSGKIKAQIMGQRKWVCHWATKTGRGFVFPGNYPQVTMEQLVHLWKLYPAKEDFELRWRRRQKWQSRRTIETKIKQVHGWAFPRCRECWCSAFMPLSEYWDQSSFFKLWFLLLFLFLDSSQATRGKHVTNFNTN